MLSEIYHVTLFLSSKTDEKEASLSHTNSEKFISVTDEKEK